MKKLTIVTFLILLGLFLVACGGTAAVPEAAEPVATAVAEVVEEAVAEPTAVVEEAAPEAEAEMPAEAGAADLDAAFATFLGDMEAYNTIGIDAVNEMIVEGNAPFLLDVREPDELTENGWIEGAVNIPLREVAASTAYLPSFDTPIVSYCGSGWRCTIAMTALEAMGWQDVKGLKGGSFGGWVEAGYPIVEGEIPALVELNEADPDPALVAAMQEMLSNVPEGFGVITNEALETELIENPDLLVIDVRTPAEVEEQGYMDAPNLTFIPLEELVASQDMWPADKDAPIVVYCGSGHRSTIAMSILWSYGYTDVHSLKGGFSEWAAAGFPSVGVPETAAAAGSPLNPGFAEFLATMQAYNTIGLEDLSLALTEDAPPFLLDVREPSEIEANGYIEGAVNIPLREIADNIAYLPSFDTPIVSYCGSGWRCTIALTILEGMGWQDVRGLKGGSLGGWIEEGYPVAEGMPLEPMELNAADPDPALVAAAQETLSNVPDGYGVITVDDLNLEIAENADLILIDVRTPAEVESQGYIDAPNVVFIPLEDFIAEQAMWPADKDAPIVTYCGSGHRSTIAMSILWANGYTDVHSMKGGFAEWNNAGYAIVEGTGESAPSSAGGDLDTAFATFLADMEGYNTISLDDLNLALIEDPPPFLLDVREPSEIEANGYIEGAVNIPLREVADNIAYLPSFDTPIVSYCGSGWRCTIALTALEAMGWEDVRGLKGGSFGGWVEEGYPVAEGLPLEPMELNAADPDPAIVAAMQGMLSNVPDGFGGISADDLNLALIENPDLIVIDVRTDAELEEDGVIEAENWIHIPLESFIENMDQWPADKDAPIVVYCGSGHRSTIAMTILWSYGYSDVQSLQGGFAEWADAGYPVAEFAAP
jgi:rhodanese-related sulfurtransferase